MPGPLIEAGELILSQDPEMGALLSQEDERQRVTFTLIASENHASLPVRAALATRTTDQYAEGYPGARFYQGQRLNDAIERLTQKRIKELFGVPHANVQPYSGSPANFEVLKALVPNGETIMGLSLDAGGHLTHGAPASVTGKDYNSVSYDVGKDGFIDYDKLTEQVKKEKPKLIVAGTTAYPRLLDWGRFREAADSVGAYLMADIAHVAGLVAGEAYPSPVPYADVVTFTGHKTFRGPRSGVIMVTQRGLDKDPEMDKKIDRTVFPGLQGGPHINTIAALGIAAHEATTPQFKRYSERVVGNAKVLAEVLMGSGVDLVTGGTDSHLVLINLANKSILGNTVAEGLERAGLVSNRNPVPHDEDHTAFYPGGLRLGTPAITSRGIGPDQIRYHIAPWIAVVLEELSESRAELGSKVDEKKIAGRNQIVQGAISIPHIRQVVAELCEKFPIPDTYI